MAHWQRKLDLYDVWQQAQEGELAHHKLAGIIADRLENLRPIAAVEEERQRLIEDFRIMADDEELEVEEFDYHMARLYDWADTPLDDKWPGKKVCWVETSFRTAEKR